MEWIKVKDKTPKVYDGAPDNDALRNGAQLYIVCANNESLYHCFYVAFAAKVKVESISTKKNNAKEIVLAWFNEDGDCYDYINEDDIYIPLPAIP